MRRTFTVIGLFACIATGATAQSGQCSQNYTPRCKDTQTISTSGHSITIGGNGGLTAAFEELITGSPATVSIIIAGCSDGGTCITLDTYTTVANSVRAPTISTPYAYYTVTATWTGGSSPTVTVNTNETTAANVNNGGSPNFNYVSSNTVAASTAINAAALSVSGTSTLTSGSSSGAWTDNGTHTFNSTILIPYGASYVPQLAWNSSGAPSTYNTGFYVVNGSSDLRLNVAGTAILDLQSSSIQIDNPVALEFNNSSSSPDIGLQHDLAGGTLNLAASGTPGAGVLKLAAITSSGTTFTATGCGTPTSLTGGASAGSFHSGTAGTCTAVIIFGNSATAPNGWACFANDLTTTTDTLKQTATTTTTATLAGTTASGDVINFACEAY